MTCTSATHTLLHALPLALPVSDRVRVCKQPSAVLNLKTEKAKDFMGFPGQPACEHIVLQGAQLMEIQWAMLIRPCAAAQLKLRQLN